MRMVFRQAESLLQKSATNTDRYKKRAVTPAKAEVHRQYEAWIPAFAGMTNSCPIKIG